MRSSTLIAAISSVMLLACGAATGDVDDTAQIDNSFLEAFPTSSDLALEADTDDAAATSDDLQNGAAYADGVMGDAAGNEPTITTIGNLTCGVFEHQGAVAELKLTACKLDRVFDYWAFRLEGRPLSGSIDVDATDPAATLDGEANEVPPTADYVTLSAGRGRKLEIAGNTRRVAGVVLYNFDATSALFGEGPTGKVAIGYHLTPLLRRVRIGQLDHSRDGVEGGVTARTGYIRAPGIGGLFAWTGLKDSLTTESGTLALGEDGVREAGHVRFGWNSAGDGRRVAWVCGGTLGQNCIANAACFDATGTITYDVDSQTVSSDISWDEVACSATGISVDEENDFVGDDASVDPLDVSEPTEL